MKHKEVYQRLSEISVIAGNAIMEIYSDEFEVETKNDNSPLTQADRLSHDIIYKALSELKFEGNVLPIVSEESDIPPYEERAGWNRFWLVDPLDGTKEFVNRRDEFTVNIALVKDNYPYLGVVYLPVKKSLYFGGIDSGTFRTSASDTKLENAVKLPLELNREPGVLTVAGSRSHRSAEFDDWVEGYASENGFRKVEIITAGSSLKFCLAAEGVVDVYPRFGPTMEWDTAAAHAVVDGAGKKCVAVNGRKMEYNKKIMKNNGFIVM